jgi:hypothetical protein
MSTPPPHPGTVVMWLLVIILFIVVIAFIFNLADIHT